MECIWFGKFSVGAPYARRYANKMVWRMSLYRLSIVCFFLIIFTATDISAAEFKVRDRDSLKSMNYYPFSTLELCQGSNECTYLSLNSRAIKNLLSGREIETGMGDNKNMHAEVTRGGVLYSISQTSSSMFRANLVSHDPEGKKLKFIYSVTLSSKSQNGLIIEKEKIASLSGSEYDKFIQTISKNVQIPNKVLVDRKQLLDAFPCTDAAKFCMNDVYYYSDYNLYLASLALKLELEDLNEQPAEKVLEEFLIIILASINPDAAGFYGAQYDFSNQNISELYRPESIVVGVDTDIDGKQYVGYAKVSLGEHTSISYSVEETNESLVQFITRTCNVVRDGNFQEDLVKDKCDFRGKR